MDASVAHVSVPRCLLPTARDHNSDMAGYYDSRIESTDEIDISGARWVFIIEKEVCLASLQLNATGWVLAD